MGLRFREEIDLLLGRVYRADEDLEFSTSNDLHIVALRFRLLRQHGFFVSAGTVVCTWRGGSFSTRGLCGSKTRDLLSLYNAAHMAIPGEEALDDAIAFARGHLEAAVNKGELKSPMAEQVSRALGIPLPRSKPRVEATYYIAEYEQEETHDAVLLELAKLDFNLVRALHLKELSDITLWWKALYDEVKLTFCRDRAVEMHFWTLDMVPWDGCSRARIALAKVIGLGGMMDDVYDVHAPFEDCQRFDQAMQRWEESAVSVIPEYLRGFYLQIVRQFNELEGMLKSHEKHRISYLARAVPDAIQIYVQEAKWSNDKYIPTFKEHTEVSLMSSWASTLCLVASAFAEDDVLATEQAVQWGLGMPDMYMACAEITRFRNDVASYQRGRNRKDMANSVECYVKEHGVTGDEAAAAITAMVELSWRRINQGCLEMDRALLPAAARPVVGMSREVEVIYLDGRDGYTFGSDINHIIDRLFVDPVPV
ncbi:hypothetical protein HU200_030082 [Digitaria exilis]|uniref:Terpene synthase n=1 Tax=Digitaria exilis TaxID=1010633 RepID=A0A835BXR1_9POAL|nr:hypothetical protein HU200_030082 [Digitaria exilis]